MPEKRSSAGGLVFAILPLVIPVMIVVVLALGAVILFAPR